MGQVIPFPTSRVGSRADREAAKVMVSIANEIDAVILHHLDVGKVDARDMAGLLAHRLGTLMRHIEAKSELWNVCERVLKAQAAIE